MTKEQQIKTVYKFYCQTFGKNPNQYKLTPQRKILINGRLNDFEVDDIKIAIRNFSRSAFHRDQGYTGLEKVLCTTDILEEWRHIRLDAIKQRNKEYIRKHPGADKRIHAINNENSAKNQISEEKRKNKKIEEFRNLDPGVKSRLIEAAKEELKRIYPDIDWDKSTRFYDTAESLAIDNYEKS